MRLCTGWVLGLCLAASPALAQSPNWLDYLNAYRASAGLPPVAENATWSDGDRKHAVYTVRTDTLAHSELSSSPYYTPEGHSAAQASNVMATTSVSASDAFAIDLWMQGPFHAVGMIDPRLQQAGFGSFRESGTGYQMAAALDVLRGRGLSMPQGVNFPIAWPGNGSAVPLGSYSGTESPDPLASCPGYTAPSGLPLIVQFGVGGLSPVVTASSLSDGGAALQHCVFTESTYANVDANSQSLGRAILNSRDAVVLVPRQPLVNGHTYTVSMTVSGSTLTWSFSVGGLQGVGAVPVDGDSDGLPDGWEVLYGLNPGSASGSDGAAGDPDGDGRTNAQEYQDGTHPKGTFVRYLAEGAQGTFFNTRIAVLNPDAQAASVLLRFLKSDGSVVATPVVVPALRRVTIDGSAVSGLAGSEFATIVESDRTVVVDRTMSWDGTGYGSHTETAIVTPSQTWYLAEGATHSGFDLFYLFQNPSTTAVAQVDVQFLLPAGTPVTRSYTVAPKSRFNLWVDQVQGLASTDVSAIVRVTNGVPVIVERAMYLSSGGQVFRAGHESAGVTTPSANWFLAEGATGDYFDEFVLVANPTTSTAQVRATFLLETGQTYSKSYAIGPLSRFNIWVDREQFDGVSGYPLANAALSTTIESTNGVPVIAERAMWWPGPTSASWQEAHNSPGSAQTSARWGVADLEIGGPRNTSSYVLVANTGSAAATVQVTLVTESGATQSRLYSIAGRARFTVNVADFGVTGRVSLIVESAGVAAPLVVERAVYSDAGGVRWAAGSNALAARLP